MAYTLYMVTCRDPKHFYIGHTKDYIHRTLKHRQGQGAAFIKRHGFESIVLIKNFNTKQEATAAESELTAYLRKLEGVVVNGSGNTRG